MDSEGTLFADLLYLSVFSESICDDSSVPESLREGD